MPSIKKEDAVYTLRNNKGNELKVTEIGARAVSLRFRDKDFKNQFVLKESNLLVDGGEADVTWKAEELFEGVKFTAELNGKSASVTYSISNDNEISIRSEGDVADISAEMIFALPDVDFRACQKGAAWEKISDEKIYPVTEPAEVMMELGMFGYDPGCPIDYLDAGLKNAANIFCEALSIEIIVYSTQDKVHVRAVEGGFAIRTNGVAVGQTVYMLKNRK